jgi:hypothetical protein
MLSSTHGAQDEDRATALGHARELAQFLQRALVSLAYNMANAGFVNSDASDTDLKEQINLGNYEVASHLFATLAFSGEERFYGLLIRRDYEARLFKNGIYTFNFADLTTEQRVKYTFYVPAISRTDYEIYAVANSGATMAQFAKTKPYYFDAPSYCFLHNNSCQ